jgi:hypothetical protein
VWLVIEAEALPWRDAGGTLVREREREHKEEQERERERERERRLKPPPGFWSSSRRSGRTTSLPSTPT